METCQVCSSPFEPRVQQRYCSVRCRSKANNARDYARHREVRVAQEQARRAKRWKPRRSLIERLEQWSMPEPNSGCRLWLGATTGGGYPIIRVAGKNVYAHRVAYELRHGPIGGGLQAMHSCDTPSCIEPDHLVAGTHRENVEAKRLRAKRWPGAR